jgi:hypothetical protein
VRAAETVPVTDSAETLGTLDQLSMALSSTDANAVAATGQQELNGGNEYKGRARASFVLAPGLAAVECLLNAGPLNVTGRCTTSRK